MAKELDGGEFWLPDEFLTDDDILMDCKSGNEVGELADSAVYRSFDFSCSGMTSPEVESDEEDYWTEWNRRNAQAKINDMIWKSETGLSFDKQKVSVISASPQSTLCSYLGGCGYNRTNYPSRVSSLPPLPPSVCNRGDAAQDVLLAVAGEVARLRILEEMNGVGYYGNGAPSPGFDSLSLKQLQYAHLQKLKQQHILQQQASTLWRQMKTAHMCQQISEAADKIMMNTTTNGLLGLSPSAWPPTLQQSQQQPPSSVIRPNLVGNNHLSKPERSGTGVFLPRQVVGTAKFQRRNPSPKQTHQAEISSSHHELHHLPHEWTY